MRDNNIVFDLSCMLTCIGSRMKSNATASDYDAMAQAIYDKLETINKPSEENEENYHTTGSDIALPAQLIERGQ